MLRATSAWAALAFAGVMASGCPDDTTTTPSITADANTDATSQGDGSSADTNPQADADADGGCGEGDPCNDGDPCTDNDVCTAGVCAGTAKVCDDGNACTVDSCDPGTGQCTNEPAADGVACDDGDACTNGDACTTGACAGTAIECDDGEACTTDSCDPSTGQCVNDGEALTGTPCDDGVACTETDTCGAGSCIGETIDCADGDPCTVDGCDDATGACNNDAAAAEGLACDDGVPCTIDDACDAAGGCAGTQNPCDDDNGCTIDGCDEATGDCQHDTTTLNGQGCFDGDLCTVADVCADGVCTAGGPKDCDDGDACTDDTCDVFTGDCFTTPVTCDDDNPCTDDTCDPLTGCAFDPAGQDGAACGGANCAGTCGAGVCVPDAGACEDSNPCTLDYCNPTGECVNSAEEAAGLPCDDTSACTTADACDGLGVCVGDVLDCDDNNECTTELCDPHSGCVYDAKVCGQGEVCAQATGECVAGNGDTCAEALPIVAGATVNGSTAGPDFNDDYGYSNGACPPEEGGWGAGAPDVAYVFMPSATASYTISLQAVFDGNLYVVTDCGNVDGSCVGGWELVGNDLLEEVTLSLSAGTPYFIIVDGYGGDEAGDYTLSVSEPCTPACGAAVCGDDGCGGSCGDCGPGEVCEAGGTCGVLPTECTPMPEPITECGTILNGAIGMTGTVNAFDDYPNCGPPFPADFSQSGEVVYALNFAAATDVTLNRVVGAPPLTPLFISVFEGGGDGCGPNNTCVGQEIDTFNFAAEAGQTYYMVLDSDQFTTEPFAVNVDCCVPDCTGKICGSDGCGGTCGDCSNGESCVAGSCEVVASACQPLGELQCGAPVLGSFDDPGVVDAFQDYQCPGFPSPSAGVEVVYSFTAPNNGTITIERDFGIPPAGPLFLAVLADEGQECDPTSPTACIAREVDSVTFDAIAGQTYYVVVDRDPFFPGDDFFGLNVTCDVPCTPQCAGDGVTCEPDGCGGTCSCNPGDVCNTLTAYCGAECEPFTSDPVCGADAWCFPLANDPTTGNCQPTEPANLAKGDPCGLGGNPPPAPSDDLCGPGLLCIDNACDDICDPAATSGEGVCTGADEGCLVLQGGEPPQALSFGACIEACDLAGDSSCSTGTTCIHKGFLNGSQSDHCLAVPDSPDYPVDLFAACPPEIPGICNDGALCADLGQGVTCQPVCVVASPTEFGQPHPDCAVGGGGVCLDVGIVGVGVCN